MFRFHSKELATDAELLRRFQQDGEINALAELFGRYTGLVYGVCMKYLKNREEARDQVMAVFEKLIRVLPAQPIGNFKGWLYVTTRNQCLMHLRARQSTPEYDLEPAIMENALWLHLEEEPEREANLTHLENCIEQLIEDQKKCVRLFFLEENSYIQVAEKTGYSMNQVKSYIQNGKRNLKICMEEHAS